MGNIVIKIVKAGVLIFGTGIAIIVNSILAILAFSIGIIISPFLKRKC